MAYFRLLASSVAAQLFGCFGLLDAGPYRLEGGGAGGVYIAAGLMDGGGRVRGCRQDEGGDECARVLGCSGNHYYTIFVIS